jgi:Na+-transporting NADH:ubiquinone oxidoreductase subunit NqrF
MTVAEKQVLVAKGATGVRLSCQIQCDSDMSLRVISRLEGSGRKDCGSPLAESLEPIPVEWTTKG